MSTDLVLDRVTAIVVSIAGAQRTPPDAGPDTPLGEGGFWLTSVDFLEVVIACEQEFGIVFKARIELTAETLRSIATLAAVLRPKILD